MKQVTPIKTYRFDPDEESILYITPLVKRNHLPTDYYMVWSEDAYESPIVTRTMTKEEIKDKFGIDMVEIEKVDSQ